MQDAYFLFTVQLFDSSVARRDSTPKRIYCIDHAMVTSVASGVLVNSGHLLENLVFTALRRLCPRIHYYKTKTGREIDFIVQTSGKTRILIQACESLADSQTRKREIAALTRIIHEASAAAADPAMSVALRLVGFLDVLSSTPAARLQVRLRNPPVARRLAKRRIHARLRRLATNLHE